MHQHIPNVVDTTNKRYERSSSKETSPTCGPQKSMATATWRNFKFVLFPRLRINEL